MMVFQKPEHNSYARHTSIANKRHGTGMATKAVVNLKLLRSGYNLKFLGITRDHLQNGEDALNHPASAGMFAVTIDGVVTVRAPWHKLDADRDIYKLKVGDFIGIPHGDPIKITEDLSTFPLCKCEFGLTKNQNTGGAPRKPIGRLVEWREITSMPGGSVPVYAFRINLCPFGPPIEMLDGGFNTSIDADNTQEVRDQIEAMHADRTNSAISNMSDQFTPVMVPYELAPVQPTKYQITHPPDQSLLGGMETAQESIGVEPIVNAGQTALGSSMAQKQYSSIQQWEASKHFSEMDPASQEKIRKAAHPSADGGAIHVIQSPTGITVKPIDSIKDFRTNVMRRINDQYEIQGTEGGSNVRVYVTKQAPVSEKAGPAQHTQSKPTVQSSPIQKSSKRQSLSSAKSTGKRQKKSLS